MIQKALVVLSSPRKGSNSSALALAMAEGLKEKGVQVEEADLARLEIKPCLGCEACHRKDKSGVCVQKDGMQEVYPKVVEADLLLLAAPVYWFNVCAQLKIFLDRCYAVALSPEGSFSRKTIAAALAYGDVDPLASGAVNAIRSFQDICNYTGARWGSCLYASAMEKNVLAADKELMAKAVEFGRNLAGGG